MTPIQLDIIRTFGSKELSEGCLLNNFGEIIKLKKDYKIIQNNESEKDILIFGKNDDELSLNHNTEILGHIPELFPDVYVAMKNKGDDIINFDKYPEGWRLYFRFGHIIPYNPTLPLLEQEEKSLNMLLEIFAN